MEPALTPGLTFVKRLDDRFFEGDISVPDQETKEIIETVRRIAEDTGILTKNPEQQARFYNFCSSGLYFYNPDNGLDDRMVTALCFLNLLWFIDDRLDDEMGITEEKRELVVRVVSNPDLAPVEDIDLACVQSYTREVRQRLLRYHDSEWVNGFWKKYIDYISASLIETKLERYHWSIEEYTKLRLLTSAVYPCVELIPMLYDLALPTETQDSLIRDLFTLTNRIISFTNDLFSYDKEQASKSLNLVLLYQANLGLELKEAVDRCVEIINHDLATFRAICSTKSKDHTVSKIILALQRMIQGNTDWSLVSGRYRGPMSPFIELRT